MPWLVLVGVVVGPLCEEGEGESCGEGAEDDEGSVEFSEEHGVSMTKPPPSPVKGDSGGESGRG